MSGNLLKAPRMYDREQKLPNSIDIFLLKTPLASGWLVMFYGISTFVGYLMQFIHLPNMYNL